MDGKGCLFFGIMLCGLIRHQIVKGGKMKRIIKIGNKEYEMKSSAYTQFKYKNDTGRKLLEDLQNLTQLQNKEEAEMIASIDDLTDIVLRISYVMIEEADPSQVTTFEDFLKGIDGLFDNTEWINEVISLAVAPISRGIQTTSPQK